MHHKKGFTLVELLVVIGIIAVLLSIIMPATMGIGESAWLVGCEKNMREFNLAWVKYPYDHEGRLVYGQPVNNPEAFVYTGAGKDPIYRGALWQYMNDVTVWQCPAAPQGNDRTYTLIGPMRGERYGLETRGVTSTGTDRYSTIIQPALQITFMEEFDRRGWNIGSWLMNFNGYSWIDYMAPFHGDQDTQCLGFADGHVDAWKWQDQRTIDNALVYKNFGASDPGSVDWERTRISYWQMPTTGGAVRYNAGYEF